MARENKPPAFQFYARDWIADTRELGVVGRGILIDLIALCWENGSVPSGSTAVATAVGATVEQVDEVWPMIAGKFSTDGAPPGRMVNNRLEIERAKQARYRKEQSDKGKASAAARASTAASAAAQPNVNRGSTAVQPNGQPEVNSTSASASASSKEKEHAQPPAERAPVPPLALGEAPAPRFDLEALYDAYPRKEGKKKGLEKIKAMIRTEADYQRHRTAIGHLCAHVARDGIALQYVPHFSTWANGRWEDYADGIPLPKATTAKPGASRDDAFRRPDSERLFGS